MRKEFLILFFIAFELIVFPLLAISNESKQSIDIFTSSNLNDSDMKYVELVDSGILRLQENTKFNIKVNVEQVTKPILQIMDQKILQVESKEIVCINAPCRKKWVFDLSTEDFDIRKFSNFQLIWKQTLGENIPDIDVLVYLSKENLKKGFKKKDDFQIEKGIEKYKENNNGTTYNDETLIVKGSFTHNNRFTMTETRTVDFRQIEYKKKTNLYLINREFGFKTDEIWQYSVDDNRLVLQGRLDIPLKECSALKLYCKYGFEPERVSFSIDMDGDRRRDIFILWEEVEKKVYSENKRQVILIDLSKAMKKKGADINKGFLLEPIIFIPMEYSSFRRVMPLDKIEFGVSKKNMIFQDANKRVFLDFDIEEFTGLEQIPLSKIKKIVIASKCKTSQSFTWDAVKLYNKHSKHIKEVVYKPGKAIKRWFNCNIPLGPNDYISSFKPLMNISRETQHTHEISKFENSTFKDTDLSIFLSNTWYKIKKKDNKITIKGVFYGKDSWLRIQIGGFSKSELINITKENLENVIVEKLDGKFYKLPFRVLAKGKGLYLAKGSNVSFLIKNEHKELTNDFGKSIIKFEKYREWELGLTVSSKNVFQPAYSPIVTDFVSELFLANDPFVKNKLWMTYYGGNHLKGILDYIDIKGEKKKKEISLSKEEYGAFLDLDKGSLLTGFTLDKKVDSAFELSFFDLKLGELDKRIILSELEWWDTEGEIFLIADSEGIKFTKEDNSSILFKSQPNQNQWIFTLGSTGFYKPLSIMLDQSIPKGCSGELYINGRPINIDDETIIGEYSGDGKINLSNTLPLKSIRFIVTCSNNKTVMKIKTPKMSVAGIRRTVLDDAKSMVVSINDKVIPVPLNNLLNEDLTLLSLGEIELKKGIHYIETNNSKFFKIKSLILERKSPIYTKNLVKYKDKTESVKAVPYKVLFLGAKLILSFMFIFTIYRYRQRFRSSLLFIESLTKKYLLKYYSIFSEIGLALFWFITGFALYLFKLFGSVRGENFIDTIASLFLVIGLWHLSSIYKEWLVNKFPKVGELVYKSKSTPFFAWAIILLIVPAIFASSILKPIVDQVVVIVYFLLVVGTLVEIITLGKGKQFG